MEQFDTKTWAEQELLRQQERIEKLGRAFTRFAEARANSDDESITPSDVVLGTQDVYGGKSGHWEIHWFLEEAVNAGAVKCTEVGGKERVYYEKKFSSLYLLDAEQSGLIAFDDGQYLPVAQ